MSLENSGYSSISEKPIYCTIDDLLEQKKAASLERKEPAEPIYAKVDLAAKRLERQAKSIKANSGTYYGLVQDKVSHWQERMKLNEQNSGRLINQQHTSNRKVETRAGFSVKEIKQKYESKNSAGYDSDTKVEQLRITPNSKVSSVNIEFGIEKDVCVIKGERYSWGRKKTFQTFSPLFLGKINNRLPANWIITSKTSITVLRCYVIALLFLNSLV
ncbi:hypothetical protein GOM44_00320 [Wolbachia endosymbiont of Atemnus politus]|uniref:hypothetical protein n=1 Tax=Wolbachia endosymbiont of Atemnus politus TaxID=2682840 RepID=UPI0019F0D2AA|nr:hypothetical protein [Wolbachia endosymbiont of Atemnus politus]NSX82993.1 hypothetical protein [Wolbachia endosymbiont of Atemnus politus]